MIAINTCLVRRPPADALADPAGRRPPARVHEDVARYEDEGSVRESRGAVSVGDDAWWSVSLTAPIEAAGADAPVRVRLRRHGEGAADHPGGDGVELLLRSSELAAVVTLLAGVTSQAIRDGVVPPTPR